MIARLSPSACALVGSSCAVATACSAACSLPADDSVTPIDADELPPELPTRRRRAPRPPRRRRCRPRRACRQRPRRRRHHRDDDSAGLDGTGRHLLRRPAPTACSVSAPAARTAVAAEVVIASSRRRRLRSRTVGVDTLARARADRSTDLDRACSRFARRTVVRADERGPEATAIAQIVLTFTSFVGPGAGQRRARWSSRSTGRRSRCSSRPTAPRATPGTPVVFDDFATSGDRHDRQHRPRHRAAGRPVPPTADDRAADAARDQ